MKRESVREFFRRMGIYLLALSIPLFLVFASSQSKDYLNMKDEIIELEKLEENLIEENKELVKEISNLSSSERIEKIAVEELGMRKAASDEIVRVTIKGK